MNEEQFRKLELETKANDKRIKALINLLTKEGVLTTAEIDREVNDIMKAEHNELE